MRWKCYSMKVESLSGRDEYSFTFVECGAGNQQISLKEANPSKYFVGKDYFLKFEEANESTEVSSS